MRRTFLIGLALLLVAAAFQVTGCRKVVEEAAENAVEQATGVEVEQDGDSVTITSEDDEGGQVTITTGEGAEVPDEFPDDFPVYDGEITGSSSVASPDGSMIVVTVETRDDFDTVKEFFEKAFADEGWDIVFQMSSSEGGSQGISYTLEKDERNATLTIDTSDGVTTISHMVVAGTE
ncbi:MAG: hypothetical protein Kow0056_05570 [Coriobacteriia bacterium]